MGVSFLPRSPGFIASRLALYGFVPLAWHLVFHEVSLRMLLVSSIIWSIGEMLLKRRSEVLSERDTKYRR
jgi:hypothetical protein